jgi:hypothetical protein
VRVGTSLKKNQIRTRPEPTKINTETFSTLKGGRRGICHVAHDIKHGLNNLFIFNIFI